MLPCTILVRKESKQQWKSLHSKCFQLGGSPAHAKLLSSLPGNPTCSSDPSHLRELRDDGSRRTPAPASTALAAAPAAAVGTPAAAAGGDSILMGSQLETTINGVCHIPLPSANCCWCSSFKGSLVIMQPACGEDAMRHAV